MRELPPSPATVLFGAGTEAAAARTLRELGAERVLLVALAHHRAGADRVAAALGDAAVGVFTLSGPQVPGATVDAAVETARQAGADWVVAHGGGSAIGVAKAVALHLPVALGALPTTYAGSERTDIWGVTRDGEKQTGRDERVRPRLVVYDPDLTASLDRDVTLASLANALAHAIGALCAVEATAGARDAAGRSLAPLVSAIRALAADPADTAARAA
ncbi:MAG: iron-containing alcohol dehydrogenase, partial [Myxococcales bacterium]|nr:iron-containing alcohol dehydrogenase [Myxococcales bacterium]